MKERPILFQGAMVRALLAGTKTQTRREVKGIALEWLGPAGFTPEFVASPENCVCPYGQPGDRLWVRETFYAFGRWETRFSAEKGRDEWHFIDMTLECGNAYAYAADGRPHDFKKGNQRSDVTPAWWKRPAIFMPRAASRILLEVTAVRAERLQAISEPDAIAEGISELVPAGKRAEGLSPAALAFATAATVEAMPKTTRRGFLAGALAATLGFAASPSRPWEVAPSRMTGAPSARELYGVLWESINGAGSWDANPWVWVVEFAVLPASEGVEKSRG